jgi:tight adherence protein C
MLVCVEAGLGIDAAFSRIGAEITTSHPLLAQLFASVALELRAGRSREDALRLLARRTAVPEIKAFVTLIIQSDKLGASISQALKIYSAEMREGRRMRAEEKAHRLPVLLSIPLVVFLLPVTIAVLMLPAAISLRDGLANVPGGM